MTLLADGRVLVVGGYGGIWEATTPVATSSLYDPVSDSWSAAASMPGARAYHTATLMPNGAVLVAGGNPGGATAEIYDPSTNTWSSTATMANAYAGHTATLLPAGKVLVVGGSNAELYDPVAGAWSAAASPGLARGSGYSTTLLPDGRVLLAGGIALTLSTETSSAEIYDPISNTWSPTGSMAVARRGHTATLLPGGKVLVAGGLNQTLTIDDPLASAELFDPVAGVWSTAASMSVGRSDYAATLLPGGALLVVGGIRYGSQSGTPGVTELYWQ